MIEHKGRRSGAIAIFAAFAAFAWHQASLGDTVHAAPAVSAQEAEGIIFERQQLMIQIERNAKALRMIVAGTEPADKLAETTRAIAEAAKDSVEAFRPVVPGGRARPEVWSQHAEYLQAVETFARNADAMAKAGETGDVVAVTGLMTDAMPCKQCHDRYRGPKAILRGSPSWSLFVLIPC
jgi:cytochrome c556